MKIIASLKNGLLFLVALVLTVLAISPARAGIIFVDTPLPNVWTEDDDDEEPCGLILSEPD